MSDHAHPAFVETVRCMLVNPRRNIRRTIDHLEANGLRTGSDINALDRARDALEQIEALEARVHDEENRTVHTCTCGHTHYVHGDEA